MYVSIKNPIHTYNYFNSLNSLYKSIQKWDFFTQSVLSLCFLLLDMKSSELGLSSMYRILKKAGAERVSDESADELRRIIEDIALEIAKNAVEMSKHAGRKTVKAEDVKLASKTSSKF